MSRWIEEKQGYTIIKIADMDECSYMYNEVCCNDESELCGDYPAQEDCAECLLFKKEEGLENE